LKIGTDSVLLAAAVPLEWLPPGALRVLDIGCGCGVVAFCLADRLWQQGRRDAHWVGIDIDAPSVEEAMLNAAEFPSRDGFSFDFQNVSFHQWRGNGHAKFDLVVSNPPFFGASLKPADPRRCLSRHRDDLLPFDELIAGTADLLSDQGRFFVILPVSEVSAFERQADPLLSLRFKMMIRPVWGKDFNRCVLGFSRQAGTVQETELSIRNADYSWSQSYRTLTECLYWEKMWEPRYSK